ncbi:hypothetical protein K470DRAFT_256890 [Piedraia hortae CBS 480.64]|uniref:Uncharacterized protein n=1 Tax=Piedraia hortae CBS 480.64 TaxID=1314780 RepID=A0A6A7C1R3_9PEZI|nr:hypothetical protein K470DRAFT_256890 [Piedraia hortae CBS 480.64]
MDHYRPPGRSNRTGRNQTNNEVFEGLPVKQWSRQETRVSLAAPALGSSDGKDDRWGELPMPQDYQLLQPWTQHILRLARTGRTGRTGSSGAKRKTDCADEEDAAEEDEAAKENNNRAFLTRRWKITPTALQKPEHKHFEFLARRRKGMPSLYGPAGADGVAPMRRAKVRKTAHDGEVLVYEALVPQGQLAEGEITDAAELAELPPALTAPPGTYVEGLGIANEDGIVIVAETRRKNRPPPKKKGGPGRGKKRVTFINPDGSTYTTIVPNATKIVPQPGQTVKHVSKGEEIPVDVTPEQAALQQQESGESDSEDSTAGVETATVKSGTPSRRGMRRISSSPDEPLIQQVDQKDDTVQPDDGTDVPDKLGIDPVPMDVHVSVSDPAQENIVPLGPGVLDKVEDIPTQPPGASQEDLPALEVGEDLFGEN